MMPYIELRNTVNEGFEIKKQFYDDEAGVGFVLGEKYSELLQNMQYVTWEYNFYYDDETKEKGVSYFWGHYFDNRSQAKIDYYGRIREMIIYQIDFCENQGSQF